MSLRKHENVEDTGVVFGADTSQNPIDPSPLELRSLQERPELCLFREFCHIWALSFEPVPTLTTSASLEP